MSVKLYGAARYRAAVAEKRSLAVWAAERVAQIPGIVMDAEPQLSLFAFHVEGAALDTQAARNAATEQLVQRVTDRGRVMLTGCTVDGRYLARVCVLSFRTRMAEMEACVQHLAEETAAILAGG
jgi:aromatic-L-amino-acid decarboxylase